MASRRAVCRLLPAALLAMSLAGCSLGLREGVYGCVPGDDATCPSGWFCRGDGRCYSTPADGGVDGDVGPDDGDVPLEDVPDGVDGDVGPDDGDVETDDIPDDGDGDGADEAGCTPEACDDGDACNGAESCSAEGSCRAGVPADPGTACTTAGGAAGRCFLGACRSDLCGNGSLDPGEACDDGNFVGGDGCEPDCAHGCSTGTDCDDGDACDGLDACSDRACVPGVPPLDGTSCGAGRICRARTCVDGWCGDGFAGGGEACDDGNDVPGDGCEPDCAWTCVRDDDCSDLRLCNGAETCDTGTHRCRPGIASADGTPCLTHAGAAGSCRAGSCGGPGCGNGAVGAGEDCDDANRTNGDGCDNDCTWSCTADADCGDGRACNGAERCEIAVHRCRAGTPLAEGSACERDGDSGTRDVCIGGVCRRSVCGDGSVDAVSGEDCDDGAFAPGDGCEPDCTWTCAVDRPCDDGAACNGAETCDPTRHDCRPGAPLAAGTSCTMPGGTAGSCRGGACARDGCGDGTVAPEEECDDGNAAAGDGCEPDCLFSCHALRDCGEPFADPCVAHACVATTGVQACRAEHTTLACDDRDPCTGPDRCDGAGACAGPVIDGDGDTYGPGAACGGDCDDGAAGIHPGIPEACNGADDDCSGTADDGPAMSCRLGTSRLCAATGSWGEACTGGEACVGPTCTWSGRCEVSATELCNGADDDCDTVADDGYDCVLGAAGACANACGVAGSRSCRPGCTWGPCLAAAEVACNGCDDDGDGRTDELAWCPVTGLPDTGDLFAIHGTAADDAWIVGQNGLAWRWNGTRWSTVASGTGRSLRGVWLASADAGWAAGDGGAIVRWNGSTWAAETSGTGSNLLAAWAASDTDAWAVGDGGRCFHRVAGTWTPVASGTGNRLRALWGVAADDLLAAGDAGTVRWWDGAAWAGRPGAPAENLHGVHGWASAGAWVVGAHDVVARWTGSGWSSAVSGTASDLHDVWTFGAASAWAVGKDGVTTRWNGSTWAPIASGTTEDLYGVWGASAREVWAVGKAGVVRRWRE